jgi:hypothetical protein
MPGHPTHSLDAKLKKCDPEVQLYVAELRKENFALQRKVAVAQVREHRYQVLIASLEDEVASLKKEKQIKMLQDYMEKQEKEYPPGQ